MDGANQYQCSSSKLYSLEQNLYRYIYIPSFVSIATVECPSATDTSEFFKLSTHKTGSDLFTNVYFNTLHKLINPFTTEVPKVVGPIHIHLSHTEIIHNYTNNECSHVIKVL